MPEVLSSVSSLSGIVDDIEISNIRHPKNQLRTGISEIEELAASISEKGLLQPIIIRPAESKNQEDAFYEIVAGNRRYEACKNIGWRKITCHIGELNDREAFEIALAENIQRSTLSPIEEAKAFKAYISDYGYGGTTQLAMKLGKSASYVTKRIALLDLPSDVITSISNSILSTSVGEELCSVKDNAKQSELAKLIATRHLSIRKIREILEESGEEVCRMGEDIYCMEVNDDDASKYQKPIEKTILILRLTMNKMGAVIDGIEDDCWPVKEILLQHKNALHKEIDTLLKEKKKCNYNFVKKFK